MQEGWWHHIIEFVQWTNIDDGENVKKTLSLVGFGCDLVRHTRNIWHVATECQICPFAFSKLDSTAFTWVDTKKLSLNFSIFRRQLWDSSSHISSHILVSRTLTEHKSLISISSKIVGMFGNFQQETMICHKGAFWNLLKNLTMTWYLWCLVSILKAAIPGNLLKIALWHDSCDALSAFEKYAPPGNLLKIWTHI